ncbi:uncharacterized protein LOC105664169 [Megachile rotundata]|uniref:uncharacterized protein LOC105664169 n=1 Tax=Megachile rotundata TaxID=143995 RepID=UPI0006152651|nr:PREDICTED: uncharacterized protein LOC105664169 [Megachile rotundata]
MVVNNATIPEVEKFHYLKLSVTGEATQLINNLVVTGDNFKLAWQLISDRYENRRVLVDAQLELLFSLKRSSRESTAELKRLHGTTTEVLGALKGLKCDTSNWVPFIVYWVSRKFDSDTLREWELHICNSTDLPTIAQLNEFLVRHIRALESMERAYVVQAPAKPRLFKPQAHQVTVSGNPCPACKSSHALASCPSYLAKSAEQRKAFVTQLLLCFNCLGNHPRKACRSKGRCNVCRARHHTSLHDTPNATTSSPTVSSNGKTPTQAQSSEPATVLHVAKNGTPRGQNVRILLATALVKASSFCGESSVIRVLLDQGSEVSFVTESLVQRLQLPRRHATVPVRGIGAGTTVVTRGYTTINITSLTNSAFSCKVRAFILPKLTTYVPNQTCNIVDLPHLQGLTLADPDFSVPLQVDLVIGVEIYSQILLSEVIRGPPFTPIAQRTQLGWIVTGPTPSNDSDFQSAKTTSLQCCVDRELVDLMQLFWQQEEYADCKLHISEKNLECENHFVATHTRDNTGRFVVRLPFACDVNTLGNSRNSAYFLLRKTEERLAANTALRQAYSLFLNEYEKLEHMRRVTSTNNQSSLSVFLPQHCVLRESSTTTKIRVVFNGSHPTSTGVSLNDCLHTGPKIQNDLADVLLRWRQ